jgi:hypothetical protein
VHEVKDSREQEEEKFIGGAIFVALVVGLFAYLAIYDWQKRKRENNDIADDDKGNGLPR